MCVERFSPFGYVLLLVHPGNLENMLRNGVRLEAPGAASCLESLVALAGTLYVFAPAEGGDCDFVLFMRDSLLGDALPSGHALLR
ncbi:hypothetical protein [Paenibacillus fonticola]|uniref:hypothetical protein n=1 Tax=Paenibacillus fonticola TaxID=379896 RepID=UPI00035CFD6F|nr:hypothetical protein [Paenibacillus fonticola]